MRRLTPLLALMGMIALLPIGHADAGKGRTMASDTPSSVTAEETTAAREWAAAAFGADVSCLPFSFEYDGRRSEDLLPAWQADRANDEADGRRTTQTLTFADPATQLEVRCLVTHYEEHPALEWVLYFENKGDQDTPILANVLSADLHVTSGAPGTFVLVHADGSHEQITDFRPHETELTAEQTRLESYGGRSSDGALPFFNLSGPDGRGVVAAIGWTGQWAASFAQEESTRAHFGAGMEWTHLRLHPGESIRSPATLLVFWGGDRIRGHNHLRRLLLDHYTPTPGGERAELPVAATPHTTIPFSSTTEANMIEGIRRIAAHGLPVDTWWIDAGWFSCVDYRTGKPNWAVGVGNPGPDPARYPNGMKPVADAAHENRLRFLLWCEPERVMPHTWLHTNHPDWLLTPTDVPPPLQYHTKDGFHLLDLGNPEALAWAKAYYSEMIGTVGIDIYRHDCNIYPLFYWRNGEAPDRQGINEIRYVTGLYEFFDALSGDHPDLLMDNCASGGRRIDFEMLRRTLTLTRSDVFWRPGPEQSMTYGLSLWAPLSGVGTIALDAYNARSGLGANYTVPCHYHDDPVAWAATTKIVNEWLSVRHFFEGDFYPLSQYSVEEDVWIAWQFDRPDLAQGMIQAFRRKDSAVTSASYVLSGLDPEARYALRNVDTGESWEVGGRGLTEHGITVDIAEKPGAVIITYGREPTR